MPEEDREEQIDRSARPPIDPPTYEEALHSLGRALTVADQDMDGDEDVEAPFLAPKDNPTTRTPQDMQAALLSLKGNAATAKDSQVSSSDESIPELINLGKEEDAPPSLSPKSVKCPTTLDKKMATTARGSPIPPPPFSKGKARKRAATVAASEANMEVEEVPEEQIIYIDDNADPSPFSLLERQVDCLLMPPPADTTPLHRGPLCHHEWVNKPARYWR